MGSRLALPALLFTVACLAGALYWISRGEGGKGPAEGPRPAAVVEPGSPVPAELSRPLDGPSGPETDDLVPERTSVSRSEPLAAVEPRAGDVGQTHPLRGRVVDGDGRPVAGATVFASDRATGLPLDWGNPLAGERGAGGPGQNTTDAEGRFRFVGLAPGTSRFAVRAAGYAPFDDNDVVVPAGGAVDLDPFVIRRGAVLSGRVLGPSGRAVEGAELRVQVEQEGFFFAGRMQPPSAVSAADGSFVLDQLACGKWEVRVESDDHPASTFEGLAERPGEEVRGLEFQLGQGAVIAGIVSEVPMEESGDLFVFGRPVRTGSFGSLTSYQDARRADVDPDGSFRLSGLEPGATYVLEARSHEQGSSFALFGGRSRSDQVKARAGDRDVQLRYQPASTVTFRVLDARTREPITEYLVSHGMDFLQALRDDDGKPIRHHEEGYARLERLRMPTAEHRLKLEIEATGYGTFRRDDIALVSGDLVDLGRIFLEPVPVLTVRVEAQNGVPVEGARVTLVEAAQPGMRVEHRISIGDDEDDEGVRLGDTDPSAHTNGDGVAVLSCPEGQTRTLRVTAGGYAAFEVPGIYFPPGEDLEQDVRLSLGGSVLVKTFTAEGDPLPGARLSHRSPGELAGGSFSFSSMEAENVTDMDGSFVFENLEPGVHAFKIQEGDGSGAFFAGEAMIQIQGMGAGDQAEWTEIEVVEGVEAQLVLVASPRGSLEGRVTEAGVPLAGATLTLLDEKQSRGPMAGMALPGMGGSKARTDGRGRYQFEDVKEGRYVLRVEHPTRHMSHEETLNVREGPNDFDLALDVAIVEGRVTGEDGKPLAGLRVSAEKARDPQAGRRFVMIMESADGGGAVVGGGTDLNADEVYTDADGRYTLRGVTAGTELFVKAEGSDVQEGKSETLELSDGEVKRGVDFVCQRAGSIEVEALLPDGSPARFCIVRAEYAGSDADDVEPEVTFLESGTAMLDGLRPGPWSVNVQKDAPGMGSSSGGIERTVEVVAGEQVTETFHLD